MNFFQKKRMKTEKLNICMSFLAVLLVLSLILPVVGAIRASAASVGYDNDSTSAYYWAQGIENLPKIGDRKSDTDSDWYRLIIKDADGNVSTYRNSSNTYQDVFTVAHTTQPSTGITYDGAYAADNYLIGNIFYEDICEYYSLLVTSQDARAAYLQFNTKYIPDAEVYENSGYSYDGCCALYVKWAGGDNYYVATCNEDDSRGELFYHFTGTTFTQNSTDGFTNLFTLTDNLSLIKERLTSVEMGAGRRHNKYRVKSNSVATPEVEYGDLTFELFSDNTLSDPAQSISVYVGIPVDEYAYTEDYTIRGDLALGKANSMDSDGIASEVTYLKSGITLTVEKGCTLNVEAPTFAEKGVTIVVNGTMVIEKNAWLSASSKRSSSANITGWQYASAVNIVVQEGGQLLINNGGGLFLGSGQLTINGGTVTNSGILSIDSVHYAISINKGGILDNSTSGILLVGVGAKYNAVDTAMWTIQHTDMSSWGSVLWEPKLGLDFGYLEMYEDNLKNPETFIQMPAQVRIGADGETSYLKNYGKAVLLGMVKGNDVSGKNACLIQPETATTIRALEYANLLGLSETKKQISDNENLYPYLTDYTMINVKNVAVSENEKGTTQAERQNVFAMMISTGSGKTPSISGFTVHYVDTDGKNQSTWIDVSTASTVTYNLASNWEYCDNTENVQGNSNLHSQYHSQDTTILAGGTTEYFFQTEKPVACITGIDVSANGSGTWTCMGLDIYQVQYLHPIEEYGYSSENWYVPFSGYMIAHTVLYKNNDNYDTSSVSMSWSSTKTLKIGSEYALEVYTNSKKAPSATKNYIVNDAVSNASEYLKPENYLFSMTLADVFGAGIEKDYVTDRKSLSEAQIDTDAIYVKLTYFDTNNCLRVADINVSDSVVRYAQDNLVGKQTIHGIFQQGEELAFCGSLPDFVKPYTISVSYEGTGAMEGDTISVAGFSIHDTDNLDIMIKNGVIQYDYVSNPLYYFKSTDANGYSINYGSSLSTTMKAANASTVLLNKSSGCLYLVSMQTDNVAEAATVNDMKISFTYTTLNGTLQRTQAVSIKSLLSDYYGYWLDEDGNQCGNVIPLCAGQEVSFVIDLSNVYKFESVTISMAENENLDAWQMSSFTIYELESYGIRQTKKLGTTNSIGSVKTDRLYYREHVIAKGGIMGSSTETVMVETSSTKTVSLSGGIISESTDVNIAKDVKELSYIDTLQDFGFDKKRVAYTVSVKVAGDSITSEEDGDCGSKNQFYFQLVFMDDNGKIWTSSYVLANQQLQGDGFRTATEETFTIYTNGDYGTPIQINIIPDDTSASSDTFDKLKIKTISVSASTNTGVRQSWITDEVGWIDIAYKDDAESSSGRTAEELKKTFALQDNGIAVTLEFGITTRLDSVNNSNQQFVGQVSAVVNYRDSEGRLQEKSIGDVVSEIAKYANRTSSLATIDANKTSTSISDFMFKAGYTNRFQVDFKDIQSIESITFNITGDVQTSWYIQDVFVRQVFDDGNLSYNKLGEYERKYSVEPQELASANIDADGIRIDTRVGKQISKTVYFATGNSILVKLDDTSTSVSVVEANREGASDRLALSVKLSDESDTPYSGQSISGTVYYKNVYGNLYSVTVNLEYDSVSGQFVIKESLPSVPFFGVPYLVELTGSWKTAGLLVEKATVCQVRDDVSIHSYDFICKSDQEYLDDTVISISYDAETVDDYAEKLGLVNGTQKVYLQVSSKSEKTLLSAGRDLQVAIVYTKKDDAYGLTNVTGYVSAFDAGYTYVSPGDVLVLSFNAQNISSIQGLYLLATNTSMRLEIEKGCIVLEEVSNMSDTVLSTGWVNLVRNDTNIQLTEKTNLDMYSDGKSLTETLTDINRLEPVYIAADTVLPGRTDAKVELELYYLDEGGETVTYKISGKASEVLSDSGKWILLENMKELRFYTLGVYDDDKNNTASVTFKNIQVGYYDSNGSYVCYLNTEQNIEEGQSQNGLTVYESKQSSSNSASYLVPLSTDSVKILGLARGANDAYIVLGSNTYSQSRTTYDTIKVQPDDSQIVIEPILEGLDDKLKITVTDVETERTYSVIEDPNSPGTYVFQPPERVTVRSYTYRVHISSSIMGDACAADFNVVVQKSSTSSFAAEYKVAEENGVIQSKTKDTITLENVKADTILSIQATAENNASLVASGMNKSSGKALAEHSQSQTTDQYGMTWLTWSYVIPYNYTSTPVEYTFTVADAKGSGTVTITVPHAHRAAVEWTSTSSAGEVLQKVYVCSCGSRFSDENCSEVVDNAILDVIEGSEILVRPLTTDITGKLNVSVIEKPLGTTHTVVSKAGSDGGYAFTIPTDYCQVHTYEMNVSYENLDESYGIVFNMESTGKHFLLYSVTEHSSEGEETTEYCCRCGAIFTDLNATNQIGSTYYDKELVSDVWKIYVNPMNLEYTGEVVCQASVSVNQAGFTQLQTEENGSGGCVITIPKSSPVSDYRYMIEISSVNGNGGYTAYYDIPKVADLVFRFNDESIVRTDGVLEIAPDTNKTITIDAMTNSGYMCTMKLQDPTTSAINQITGTRFVDEDGFTWTRFTVDIPRNPNDEIIEYYFNIDDYYNVVSGQINVKHVHQVEYAGSYMNANTFQDETCYYCSCGKVFIDYGLTEEFNDSMGYLH